MHASLIIDTSIVADNYRSVQAIARDARCAAVVKADAYGLGAAKLAPVLQQTGCRDFFVASCEEGIILRDALGDESTIYILHGIFPSEPALCAEHHLTPILNTLEQIALWKQQARVLGKPLPAALHLDTGMHRLGLTADDVETLQTHPEMLDGLHIKHIMSHLSCPDDPLQEKNHLQRQRFDAQLPLLPKATYSLSNSSGIYLGAEFHYDMVRPGAALYGVNPTPDDPNPVRQVITLKAPVLQLRTVHKGESVGYGITYTTTQTRRLATLPLGYADGVFRCLGNEGAVYFGDYTLPICGRVSMDLITVDISETPEGMITPETELTLIDERHTVGMMARDADTIGYEVLTRLGSRYQRVYK